MKSVLFNSGRRTTAMLALWAMLLVLMGSTSGFAAGDEAGGEPCVGCAGCDSGECGGDDEDATSHHHCCTSCCMSHAALALPTAPSFTALILAESTPNPVALTLTSRSPEAPYRPPRV